MYYESDFELECDECGPGPPPVFNIPPPPRPDFLRNEVAASTGCLDSSLSDYDMCEAIPVSFGEFFMDLKQQTTKKALFYQI